MITTHGSHHRRARVRLLESAVTLVAGLAIVIALVAFIGTRVSPGFVCAGRSLASPSHTCSAQR